MALTLHIGNKNYSSWSLRPWLAMRQAGVAFHEEVIPLDQPGTRDRILRVSPSGRVPALVDGDLVIWESLAICEYVAERFPEARLWPAERAARAVARSVANEMHAGFAALRTAMPMNLRRPVGPPAEVSDAVRADVDRVKAIWTACRARHGEGGDLLFGAFSIADAMYAPVVARFRTYAVPLDGGAAAYADAVFRLPAVREWVEAALTEDLTMPRYEGQNAK